MADLMTGFQERLAEVNSYIEFLTILEQQAQNGPPKIEGAAHSISAEQQKILYAGVYIQLYNLTESTITRCIEAVANAGTQRAVKPGELSPELRREWVRSKARTHVDMTPDHRLQSALALATHLVDGLPVTDFVIEKGGGGNWDDSEIESIIKRLGCNLTINTTVRSAVKRKWRDDLGALSLTKKLRNKLAHGEISFAQCAEGETVANLIDLKNRTVDYLLEIVRCFVDYIQQDKYLAPKPAAHP